MAVISTSPCACPRGHRQPHKRASCWTGMYRVVPPPTPCCHHGQHAPLGARCRRGLRTEEAHHPILPENGCAKCRYPARSANIFSRSQRVICAAVGKINWGQKPRRAPKPLQPGHNRCQSSESEPEHVRPVRPHQFQNRPGENMGRLSLVPLPLAINVGVNKEEFRKRPHLPSIMRIVGTASERVWMRTVSHE